jgi:hypothetical protein
MPSRLASEVSTSMPVEEYIVLYIGHKKYKSSYYYLEYLLQYG